MNDKFESAIMEIDRQSQVSKWEGKGKTFGQILETYKSQEEIKYKINFKPWLTQLGNIVPPLIPGEMFCILADTGGGKTLFIQQMILKVCAPLKTLFFEMELPDMQLAERFIAMKKMTSTRLSEAIAKEGGADSIVSSFDHLKVYSHIKFTIKDIEEIIDYEKPQVVIVDYMGLIRSDNKSRYERLSDTSEELKLLAMTKDVIMITASQVSRNKERKTGEIFLHDARDSSSIENSSQKIIGIWREGEKNEFVKVKVLKNQGLKDMTLTYNLNVDTLNIYDL